MAVSILEAQTARTAGEYLPVSRVRPRADLVQRAGIDFCRERLLVPLWLEPSGVVVATTRPRDHASIRELRERLGRPLIVRLASAAEIRIAIASAVGVAKPAAWRRGLADVLEALRVLTPAQGARYVVEGEGESALGAALVRDGLLSEAERAEAVGLAFGLPNVALAERRPTPGLDALLTLDELRALRVLPLWHIEHELFVAVADPPTAALMERLETTLGFALRPVLVDPAELDRALAALRDDGAEHDVEAGRAARRAGLASAADVQSAVRLAAQTGESFERALSRVAGIEPAALQDAITESAGIGRFQGASGDDREALPLAYCRARRVAVAGHSGSTVTLAMVDPWDRRTVRAVEAVLGAKVQIVAASSEQLHETLALHGGGLRTLPVGDHERSARLLMRAGYVDEQQAAGADIDLGRYTHDTLQRLWYLLSDDARSEAVALDAGLPPVRSLLLRPDPQALTLRDAGDEPPLLPLLQSGDLLTVVLGTPEHAEAARVLAARHHRSLRLGIALEEQLDEALAILDGVRLEALTEHEVELARRFEREAGLSRAQVLALFGRAQRTGEPLDVACVRLRLLSAVELRDLLARVLDADPLPLHRIDRIETMSNERGVSVSRRVIDDPVDLTLASALSVADARRLGALPVRVDGGVPVVAMVDPLDYHAIAELQRLLGRPFVTQPATRADIVDAALRAHGTPTVGDLLFEAGLVTRAELDRALEMAERSDVRVGEALTTLGVVSEDELTEQLATQRNLPFVALRGMDLDPRVAEVLPEELARAHQFVPVAIDADGVVTIALADPTSDEAIAAAHAALDGRAVTFVATTRADVRDGLERLYHRAYLELSAADLLQRRPEESAYRVLSRGQKWGFIALVVALVAGIVLWTVPTLTALLALSTAFYLAFSGYKFYLIYRALSHTLEVPVTDEDLAALDDRDLPVYTLLVPLYRETAVLPTLVQGIERLDYPKEKLDVKLLLEEDDVETIAVARLANLPAYFDITIVPDGQPKGKPKACNYGLLHARGEYAVIFDAEDIPERDQLKRVLVAFARSADNVICVQAKLNYYNRNQNALTKWFTTEYSTWFDLFLPGLDASGAPIPLGGTSNHFKVDALRVAGAWDPFNVTEDADLGLRIFKLGGRTAVVDSTTFEEANSQLDNWIRQRSRWVKGYIQTWLVHMRNPYRLWRQLGTGGFLSFQLVIGGTFFGFLLNPLLWALTGIWFLTEWSVIQEIFPAPVYYMGAVSLYAGNFAFAYMNVAGCLRRRYYSLVKWALLSPIYWVLMSIAAWKGFLQLFYRPFYWEKTVHGLSDRSGLEQLAELTAPPAVETSARS